jgi:hypothetical protein
MVALSVMACLGQLSWKASENAIPANSLRKLFEVHVSNGQIVFDALNLSRNCAETATARFVQIDHKDREILIGDTRAIDDKKECVTVDKSR